MIEFLEAGFAYGGRGGRPVLRDVSLALAPGSFTLLCGQSGAGKTTLMRLAWLDLAPDSGAVRFHGRAVSPRDRDRVAELRRRIGVVAQVGRFLDHLPLVDNIALPLRVAGLDVAERAADIEALLDWVDLGGRVRAMPAELSGGERQRAALARAVILSPEAILADEPTAAVDWEMALRLLTLLVELNRMGKTVLIATRDPNLVRAARARAEARVLRLADGRVETEEAAA